MINNISLPILVTINNSQNKCIALVKKANAIIKKERKLEFQRALSIIEQGGYYISSDLEKFNHEKSNILSSTRHETLTLLTEMELKVVEEIILDKTNQEIAETLFLSKRTVEYYVTSCIQKLEVNSRVGLAVEIIKYKIFKELNIK